MNKKPLSMYLAYKALPAGLSKVPGLENLHVTVSFMKVQETGYLDFSKLPMNIQVEVDKLEYWPGPDITVMLVKSETLMKVRGDLETSGFTYEDHEFKPHITLCKGDSTGLSNLILPLCRYVQLTSPYLKVKQF